MPDAQTPSIDLAGLVQFFVSTGTLMTGPLPLDERMKGLFAQTSEVLGCDHINLMTIDNDVYWGRFTYGLPSGLEAQFPHYRVERSKEMVQAIEACDSYLLFNDAHIDPALQRIAKFVGIQSTIIVPFTQPDGSPFGYLTFDFKDRKSEITLFEAELAMGIARFAQAALLHNQQVQRRREVSEALLEVADSERRRLSRDIHDDPLQLILALRIGLEAFRQRLDDNSTAGQSIDKETSRSEVDRFIQDCRAASASLREVMLRTHPTASELADLEQTLHALIEQPTNAQKINFSFSDHRDLPAPGYLIPALNRIAEQAVRNSRQHASATSISVTLANRDGGTLLRIVDDGSGFDPHAIDDQRLGLVSMRERTELLHGTFRITSASNMGTTIEAWFPHAANPS